MTLEDLVEYSLIIAAYGAIAVVIIIFLRNSTTKCNQDCCQGRKCKCKGEE